MDPVAFAARLEAERNRFAGTDAERRAAALAAAELRALGRSVRTQPLWFRPQRDLPRSLHAALGVAASVVAVNHSATGLALAAGALLLSLLDAAGIALAVLPLARRATQNVVAAPIDDPPGAVRLVLSASADQPRDSVLARAGAHLRGPVVPGPAGILDLALLAVAACAGARLAGAGGTVLGIVQLLPTVVLIALCAGFLEAAVAGRPGAWRTAAGPAAAIATAAALDARPPRRLAVEVLIAGAGETGSAGMRSYVRARRRAIAPEDVVVLHLAGAPGPVRFMVREGERFALRLHPRVAELAAELPGVERSESRTLSGARAARGRRWPAMTLTGPPADLAAAALRLVSSIDTDLVQGGARRHR